MVLADTSVRVGHLRRGNAKLAGLLNKGKVVRHACVVGELACGRLHQRKEILSLLQALLFLPKVEDDELLFFIERHGLRRRGLGLIDIHLLASACLSDTVLWTMDKKLRQAAKDLRRAAVPFKLSS